MISIETIKTLLYKNSNLFTVVAQDDDYEGIEHCSESGYVVVKDNTTNEYAIGRYSHCSCYGTWSAMGCWSWVGTREELLKMATNRLDPDMPEREADPEDYDYDHLVSVYQQVLGTL